MLEHFRPFARKAFLKFTLRPIFCVLKIVVVLSLCHLRLHSEPQPYFSIIHDPNGSYQLLENQYYKFSRSSGSFYISDQIGGSNSSIEVFPARASTSGEYTLFRASSDSSRQFYYFDPSNLDYNGSISIVPYLERGPVVSDNLAMDDYFGYRLAINDWNETIISSPAKNSNDGAIYVFDRNASFEFSQDYILQPEIGDNGWWGTSLDVAGNLLFIGAPDSNTLSGKVIVYHRINGAYSKLSEITDPNTGSSDSFGAEISADLNGSILCIAPKVSGSKVGRVEVFNQTNGTSWIHSQTLWSDNNQTGNYFGANIGITENNIIVGAPRESKAGQNNVGQAYIFQKDAGGNWSTTPTVLTSTLSPGDEFGSSVEISDNFAFVGAKDGDGNVSDTGAVYIFKSENNSWTEKAKLYPPTGGSEQTFGADLAVMDDFLFVTSLGTGTSGIAYVYKMQEGNASDWRLISRLDNNGSTVSNAQFFPVAVSRGLVVLGSPEDSSNFDFAGSVKGFYNEAWQKQVSLPLEPLFLSNSPAVLNILEDSTSGASYLFQVEHPLESNFTWSISSSSASTDRYNLSADGNFTYMPEGNFSGLHTFNIETRSIGGLQNHAFQVDVAAQPDSPVFDSNQSSELNATWVGDTISYVINTFDADGDNLTLTSSSLPSGLNITGNNTITGSITDDSLLGGATFKDFNLELSISDGTGTPNATKVFTLRVYARNLPPSIVDQNGVPISSITVTLQEDFNDSDWLGAIGVIQFQDDQTTTGFSISPVSSPSNGVLSLDPSSSLAPIIYRPNPDYVGTDSFSIALHDASVPSKSFTLPFTVIITPVNDAPAISSSLLVRADEGIPFSYQIQWTDIDGDVGHVVEVADLPGWLAFDSVSTISGTALWENYQEDPYQVSLRVTDPGGLVTNQVLVIEVIPTNYPPRFNQQDMNITINEDSPFTLPLSAYDQDVVDGAAQWIALTAPIHGECSFPTNGYTGNFQYIPEGNFTGTDFIKIKIFDPIDPSAHDTLAISITIQSVEDPPVINTVPRYTDAVIGHMWKYDFSIIDGDINQTVSLLPPLLPQWLTLENNLEGNASRARILGTPTSSSFLGKNSITLQVSDNTGLVGTQVFDVDVLAENTAPIINEGNSLNVELVEDSFWQKTNPLSSYDANKQRQNWSISIPPSSGVSVIDAQENNINLIKYTPNPNFNGSDSMVVQVSDGISSDQFTYLFDVKAVDDVPLFTSNHDSVQLRFEDGEQVMEVIEFSDGDKDLNRYTLTVSPSSPSSETDWLHIDNTNFLEGQLVLTGKPLVKNEDNYTIEISVFDSRDSFSTITFKLEVYVNNYPPVITFSEKNLDFQEDQGEVRLGVLSVDDRDQQSGHDWSILSHPIHGQAILSVSGNSRLLYYKPDGNYSGVDEFIVKVKDAGTENGASKSENITVQLSVQPVPDKPVFISLPPTEAFENEAYTYLISTKDGDLPSDQLTIKALSKPNWLSFTDEGNGMGRLSGVGEVSDEGYSRITLKVEDATGNFAEQTFLLNFKVLDYPPIFKSAKTSASLEKITLYINEDQSIESWTNPKGFNAINPDPEVDDFSEILWTLRQGSTAGSTIRIGGSGGKPTLFNYKPKLNFVGNDYFSLLMDEGDRTTELDFEIQVSAIPDSPLFQTDLQPLYFANEGELFELKVVASDIDSTNIQFRLIGPSWDKEPWLKLEDYNASGNIMLRGVPQVKAGGSLYPFTIIAMDESGLVVSEGFEIEVKGINLPPNIIPDEIEILFDQNGSPISTFNTLHANDPEGDLLKWSILEGAGPQLGLAIVEGNGSLPQILEYRTNSFKAGNDKFTVQVSDGINSDKIIIKPVISWDGEMTIVGEISDFSIKENQGFFKEITFYPSNQLDQIELTLADGPSWLEVKNPRINYYQISGIAPTGSTGSYNVKFVAQGEITTTREMKFNLEVQDGRPPHVQLLGGAFVRISDFQPFIEPGFLAKDADGIDISSSVKVTENLNFDEFGYGAVEYSVTDQFNNQVTKKRILRQYSTCPLVVNQSRMKFSGKHANLDWGIGDQFALFAEDLQILEMNGVLQNSQNQVGPIWKSLANDFSSVDSEQIFTGAGVEIVAIRNSHEGSYVAGYFAENMKVDSSNIYSDFAFNIFIASFNAAKSLNWIKSFGSDQPIEHLSLSLRDDGGSIVAGSFSGKLELDKGDYIVSNPGFKSSFICEFQKNGVLFQKAGFTLSNKHELGDIKSLQNANLILTSRSNQEPVNEIIFHKLDPSLSIEKEFLIQSSDYLWVNDFDVSKNKTVIVGEYKGNLSLNEQLLLSSVRNSGFILCLDENLKVIWMKSISSSMVCRVTEVEVDYLGDLLIGLEFSGSLNIGIGLLESKGNDDLLFMLFHAVDGSPLWFKQLGGSGKEELYSMNLNTVGSPVVVFNSSEQVVSDGVVISSSYSNEYDVIKLSAQSGPPQIQVDKVIIDSVGPFSFNFDAIHPEYLFFTKVSGPEWIDVVATDPSAGKALIVGNTNNLSLEDIEKTDNFTIRVFTMDGNFQDKTIPIEFIRDEEFNLNLGSLPAANNLFNYVFEDQCDILKIIQHPENGWILAGHFPGVFDTELSTGRFTKSILHLSEKMELSLISRIGSDSTLRLSDIQVDADGLIFAYGMFSGNLNLSGGTLTSRGGTDLFILSVSISGDVRNLSQLGSNFDEYSYEMILLDRQRIAICGSFENSTNLGGEAVSSKGSEDGFIAVISAHNISEVKWARSIGDEGRDKSSTLCLLREDRIILGTIGEIENTSLDLGINFKPQTKFDLNVFDFNGTGFENLSFHSSGRINNGKLVKNHFSDSMVLAFEFEKELSWNTGSIISRGGFDIFSTSIDFSFLLNGQFCHTGGVWNDRLTSLKSLDSDHYLFAMNFYQSTRIGNETVLGVGSSDALIAKVDLQNHKILDSYSLSSPLEDKVHAMFPISKDFIIYGGMHNFGNLTDNSSKTFISSLGERTGIPKVLTSPPSALSTSYPFDFDLRTGPWYQAINHLVMGDAEQESLHTWMTIKLNQDGTLNFSGIAPDFETNVPLDFQIFNEESNQSVLIKFNLEITKEKHFPVIDMPSRIEVLEGEDYKADFNFYDEDGDELSFSFTGPDWIKVQILEGNMARLEISSGSNVGEFKFESTVIDQTGLHSEHTANIVVKPKEKIVNDDSNITDDVLPSTWFSDRYNFDNGWSFHYRFGWIYIGEAKDDSLWMWKEGWGWLWTRANLWNEESSGYFFRSDQSSWIFWNESTSDNKSRAYDFKTKQWTDF